jgi:hypothetical protein
VELGKPDTISVCRARRDRLVSTRRSADAEKDAVETQQIAEKRLKDLCEAWKVATEFVEANLPAAIYDAKGRLHDVFAFDENCR